MDLSSKIGVALIGCGYSGCELHGVWYKDIPEIKLVTAVDSNLERARKAAERFGATSSTNDWRAVLNDPDVSMVDVNVPPGLNREIVVAAAEAGKHILCEKPMATSLQDADAMIAAADRNHVKFMIGHVLHFFPEYAEVKEAVAENVIGKLHAGNAIRWLGEPYFPFSSTWNKWYGSRELGGGVTFSMQIHDLDFLKAIFGKVRRVQSFNRNFTHREFDIDDFSVTALFFEKGMAVTEASWASPSPFAQQLDLFGEDGFLSLRTGGTLTSIEASKGGPAVIAYLKDGSAKEFPTGDVNGYCEEIRHFVSCVIDDKKPCLDPRDSRETLRVTLAALESATTGKVVELE
jgi:UDP-N-acetylglucosamine 3-dehydrogenase